ncbi:MAG TPA: hypothetical protein VG167_01050 [Verrucomicrobiae bacterium]|nr:hypothetical protein [Verrucomicrobiae bacterium]
MPQPSPATQVFIHVLHVLACVCRRRPAAGPRFTHRTGYDWPAGLPLSFLQA